MNIKIPMSANFWRHMVNAVLNKFPERTEAPTKRDRVTRKRYLKLWSKT